MPVNHPAASLAVLMLLGLTGVTRAQLAVSANDGKAELRDGVLGAAANPVPDNVAVIDLTAFPPKVIGEVKAPTSVVGPPQSVAVAGDETIALITGAMKIDPVDPTKLAPNDALTVIDLQVSPPAVLAHLTAGLGASGVSINPAGNLALVANRVEGTVSAFTIEGKKVRSASKLDLGNPKAGPCHIVFTPDGSTALLTRDGDNMISVLAIAGSKVELTGRDMSAGLRPDSIDITPTGRVAVVANIGPGTGDADTVSVIDVAANPPRVVETVTVGQTPEGVALSADGAFLAVTVMNGSNKTKTSAFYNDFGLVKVFRLSGTVLTPITEARVGHWCQGAAWSTDHKTLLVQCMTEHEIFIFGFDGSRLTKHPPITLSGGPAGIRTAKR